MNIIYIIIISIYMISINTIIIIIILYIISIMSIIIIHNI